MLLGLVGFEVPNVLWLLAVNMVFVTISYLGLVMNRLIEPVIGIGHFLFVRFLS